MIWPAVLVALGVGLWVVFDHSAHDGLAVRRTGPEAPERQEAATQSDRRTSTIKPGLDHARVRSPVLETDLSGGETGPYPAPPIEAAIRGLVRLPSGLPAQDEVVEFFDQGRPGPISPAGHRSLPFSEVRTDLRGAFLQEVEPYRTVMVRLIPRDPSLAVVNIADVRGSGTIQINLQEAGSAYGRLAIPGVPAAGLEILVTEADRYGLGVDSVHFTQEDGGFLIERLAAGEHVLQVLLPGTARLAKSILIRPGEHTEVQFAIDSPQVIRGIVVDAITRSPIIGAEIGINGDFDCPARSGREGIFELVLEASIRDSVEAACRAEGYGTRAFRVVDPKAVVEVEMRNELVVKGRVEDDAGNGLAQATVEILRMPEFSGTWAVQVSSATDESGAYEIHGVEAGSGFVVVADRPGYGPTYVFRDSSSAQEGILDAGIITLPGAGGIIGRNVDSTGRGLGGFVLYARRVLVDEDVAPEIQRVLQWRSARGRVRSSPSGEFVFPSVAPGQYLVSTSLTASGAENMKSAMVEVFPGTPYTRIEFEFDLDAAIEGRITREDGLAVEEAYVFVYKQDGPPGEIIGKGPAGPGGVFTISDVPPGRYRLVVRIPPHARGGSGARESASMVFSGIVAPVSGLELRLPDAETIRGFVVDAEDRAVPGALVVALQDNTVVEWCNTDNDGSFVIQAASAVNLMATRTIREQTPEGEKESADNTPGHRVFEPNVLPGTANLILRLPISLDH